MRNRYNCGVHIFDNWPSASQSCISSCSEQPGRWSAFQPFSPVSFFGHTSTRYRNADEKRRLTRPQLLDRSASLFTQRKPMPLLQQPTHTSVLGLVRCPLHPDTGQLIAGKQLVCCQYGRTYLDEDGIPDLVVADNDRRDYLQSEARQWDEQADRYDSCRGTDPSYQAGVEAAADALTPKPGELILEAVVARVKFSRVICGLAFV
jgi:hypothetical protein